MEVPSDTANGPRTNSTTPPHIFKHGPLFICAILFHSDILEQIVFIPSGFEQTSRQGVFLLNFRFFFRETTFLESNAGEPPMSGGSRRAGLVVSTERKEGQIPYRLCTFVPRVSRCRSFLIWKTNIGPNPLPTLRYP